MTSGSRPRRRGMTHSCHAPPRGAFPPGATDSRDWNSSGKQRRRWGGGVGGPERRQDGEERSGREGTLGVGASAAASDASQREEA